MRPIAAPLLLMTVACLPALAAPAPPPPSNQDAAKPDPLKSVFEALPEDQRRAVQDALLWTGDFNGVVSGGYGPRTHDGLLSFGRRAGFGAAAVLDPSARARLLAEADAARRAVGFAVLRDARTGVRLGLPLKRVPNRSDLPSGTRYSAADGTIVADTLAKPDASQADLADVFDRLTREAPGRRVTYRLAKPDFVVVSGETGERKFYARYALGTAPGAAPSLRGFALSYPKADTGFDAVALAVAASFDPFPAPDGAAKPPTRPIPAAAAPPAPPTRVLIGQAVLVGADRALARVDAARCDGPDLGGVAATWVREDATSGLVLLALSGHGGATPIPLADAETVAAAGGRDGAETALFLVPAATPDAAPVLSTAGVERDGSGRVDAPFQTAGAGAVLVDGRGALAGLAGVRDGKDVMVAGVVASARYAVTDAGQIAAFLRAAAIPTRQPGADPRAPGELVAQWRSLILPLRCLSAASVVGKAP